MGPATTIYPFDDGITSNEALAPSRFLREGANWSCLGGAGGRGLVARKQTGRRTVIQTHTNIKNSHPSSHTYKRQSYIYTHTSSHTYVQSNKHTYSHTYKQSYAVIHTYSHIYSHTYSQTYIHTVIHTYSHTYIHDNVYNNVYNKSSKLQSWKLTIYHLRS